jgi:TonB-dependent receptor
MKSTLFFTLFFLSTYGFGQFTLTGTVTGKTDDLVEPIPFANILIKGTEKGASSDFDGKFILQLKKGTYILVISSVGLDTKEVKVEIIDKDVSLPIELTSSSTTIKTFTVIDRAVGGSVAMDINETKGADGLQSVIGSEKMEKTGASSADDAAKKVVGLSVVGSGNVYVRGMGDRYNSAYLNGLPIASPDPDKKVIPLDLFPTNVIKSMAVKKAFLPNLEGDFAGGAMDISTKDYPSEKIIKVSLGTGFNSQSIGRQRMTYQGGRLDYLGFDDGTRSIPVAIANQEAYRSTEGDAQLFANNLNPVFKSTIPNSSFGLFAGNQYELKNKKSKIGFLITLNHSNDNKYSFGKYRVINTQEDIQIDYDFEDYTTSTSSSAMASVGFDINENHLISYNFLYVNTSEDQTKEVFGSHWDYARNVYARRFTFKQNNLMNNQLSGSHFLLKDNKLRVNWSAALNNAKSTEPDRRQLVYFYDDKDDTENYTINATDRIENHRFFSFLNERQFSAKLESKYIFKYNTKNVEDGAKLALTIGGMIKRKNRDFDFTQYVYDMNLTTNSLDVLNPDSYISPTAHEAGEFSVQEALNPASAYLATQNINSVYGFVDYNLTPKFELIAGARLELSDQKISYLDQTQPDFKRINRIVSADVLPSLILKYQPNDTNIVRFSASKTISRPGFKEVAPFQYTELFAGATTVGNPELVNGENYNLDLRYERYPRLGEFMAVGVFYKKLINPIEKTMEVATNQLQSFRNAGSATVAGLELEYTKSLSFLAKSDSSFLKFISLGINATYLYSQVSFDPEANLAQTNSERALQGASPYLINIDLAFSRTVKKDVKVNASLSYNVFGRRIYNVGIYGLGDVYELPVNALNLVAGVELEHFSFGVKVKNILNQDVRFEQETPTEPILINSTRRGVFTSLSVGYKF